MADYTMQLALCDDEPTMLEGIAAMVDQAVEAEGISCEVSLYHSGSALLEAIRQGEHYHALLLDVLLGEMTGLELAAALREQKNDTAIVFISSNREMAVCGYEVSALRYLTKPVDMDKLREALHQCYTAGLGEEQIVLTTEKGACKLPVADILYAETWGRELRITMVDGAEKVAMKLSDLEALLPPKQFVMCHRTILVNLAWVKYLRYCELELKTGGTLPVSKYRQNAVREMLFGYLEG